jgi:hypothetical protein
MFRRSVYQHALATAHNYMNSYVKLTAPTLIAHFETSISMSTASSLNGGNYISVIGDCAQSPLNSHFNVQVLLLCSPHQTRKLLDDM